MKMTLKTVGIVEKLIGMIEGNKKNTVINSILLKSFMDGSVYESMIGVITDREIQNIKEEIKLFKEEFGIKDKDDSYNSKKIENVVQSEPVKEEANTVIEEVKSESKDDTKDNTNKELDDFSEYLEKEKIENTQKNEVNSTTIKRFNSNSFDID